MTMRLTRAAMRSMDAALAVENEAPTCAICLEPLSDAARVRHPCEHDQFCGQCLCNHLLRDVRCPICRSGNDGDAQSYISDTEDDFEAARRERRELKEREKKAMEDARRRAKTDKRVQNSFDKIREWKAKAAALKAISKEKRGVLNAAENLMISKIKLYEEQLDVEFKAEYGEMEKAVKQARADYKKAKGRAKQINTLLIRRYIRDA
jgi:hypothetical protein